METKMTNEEKAKELLEELGDCESIDIEECRKRMNCNLCQTERALMQMAEWKDKQLQSMLNGLPPSIKRLVKAVGEAIGINFDNFY